MQPRHLLVIGSVVKPHGLTGELVVALVTNRLERLEPGTVLLGRRSEEGDAGDPELSLRIEASRPHQSRFLVRFEHVRDRETADLLRGITLLAEAIDDPDALFVHDLVGCELIEANGRSRGRVVAVQSNPASDLLVGEAGWLVPLRFVVERTEGRVVVDVPEGLFD